MTSLKMAVVGVGHLGKEHARILSTLPGVQLVGVVDPRQAQAETIAQRYNTRPFTDHRHLPPDIDAVVIAAPTFAHHSVALDFLRRGAHLLIEKPLTSDLAQADEIVDMAQRSGVLLQLGHIERFNPAFEVLQRASLRPKYIHAERCSGFSGRSTDVGVVFDMMIHDLDLILSLAEGPVRRVEALGAAVLGGHEDVAQARITFASGCIADLMASRVHPASSRLMHLWGPEGQASVDFGRRSLTLIQPAQHLQQRRLDSRRLDAATLTSLRTDLFGRHLQVAQLDCNQGDQLTREIEHFVECVRTGRRPRVDGVAGRDAVALATRVLDSIHAHCWEGEKGGSCGPWAVPSPCGQLFLPPAADVAA
jgi:predicted dehydrogenase